MTNLTIFLGSLVAVATLGCVYLAGWYIGKMQGYEEGYKDSDEYWMGDDAETLMTALMEIDPEVMAQVVKE